MWRKTTLLATPLLAFCVAVSSAQGSAPASSDSARCDTALGTPTRDSVLVTYDAIVAPFDTAERLSVFYREMIGQGLRQELKLPRPLTVDTYDNPAGEATKLGEHDQYATATLISVYRLTLHRNGRLTTIRAVGGVRNPVFNDSIVAALVRLDSEQMLPPPPDSTGFDHDTLEVRVKVQPEIRGQPPRPGSTSLFQLRLPLWRIEKTVALLPNQRPPRYPPTMRDQRIEGEVLAQFVVRPNGAVDATRLHFLNATRLEFASAVAQVVPSFHFRPMQIDGCSVATLVQMPFKFGLNF